MAKQPHRIFEIYESREEAIRALLPKAKKAVPEATAPESWGFRHLTVSRTAGVTHVQFKAMPDLDDETLSGLREDFAQLAEKLRQDSKVVLDFTGVVSFGAALIDALILFHKLLRIKGSRIGLCCLAPTVRESFFGAG